MQYILKNINHKNFLIPNYNCESVINCFSDKNIIFYDINSDFSINKNDLYGKIKNNKVDCILIIDFFGIIDKEINNIIEILKNNNILIIQDFTHNIFTNNFYGDISYCSCRKILEIPFGGYYIDKKNILPSQDKNLKINF